MIRLNKEQILLLHADLINKFGGSHGIRDEGLLESALNAPFQSFGGRDFYPSIVSKAARLGYGLIQNHPFMDGNKRIGAHTMLALLSLNRVEFSCSNEELICETLRVAAGHTTFDDFLLWVVAHIKNGANEGVVRQCVK